MADPIAKGDLGQRSGKRRLQRRIGLGAASREGLQLHRVVNDAVNRGRQTVDQPVRSLRNGLKHRLHVIRRTGDHLQDVGGGGLPLQRFPGLVEQPHILDGDHGLIGEGPDQFDLLWRKRVNSGSAQSDRANWPPLPHQRHAEYRTNTSQSLRRRFRIIRVRIDILHLNDGALPQRARRDGGGVHVNGDIFHLGDRLARKTVQGRSDVDLPFLVDEDGPFRRAQAGSRLD